jgi:predicted membrane channel-forming protein YqfA (hemolysin III family)
MSLADLIAPGADTLSLILIVATFLVITYLALRAKTIRSFQFEMFVVLLVLVLAEIPKILNSLAIINISSIETTGLIIHTVSMVFLSVFILLRAVKYLR